MNKKILAVAIAGALSAPSAFAATDTSGMQYTSASEGFYGSLRLRFNSGGNDNAAANIENSSSRIGVRGTLDLGGGLEGFYQWEVEADTDGGREARGINTRLAHVGLRGGWGRLMVGTDWTALYNMTYGSTDQANVHSGNLVYNTLLPGRADNMIEYTSPDLSGFQGAIAVVMDNTGSAKNGTATAGTKDANDLDQYMLSAKYEVQGFSAAIGYTNIVEALSDVSSGAGRSALASARARFANVANDADITAIDDVKKTDWTALVYKLGYAQDNWWVNGWYSVDNTSDDKEIYRVTNSAGSNTFYTYGDGAEFDDTERLSLAAGVGVGKVNLYAIYEAQEHSAPGTPATTATSGGTGLPTVTHEDERTTVGVQYNLGARSRVWVEYAGQDFDSNPSDGDYINIGLRHDF